MNFPPAVYIIGAQKAGTTTLAYLLDQHPAIVLSNPKEPHFFSSQWERGWVWYRSCFAKEPGILIDASTSYTMAPLDEKTGLADDTIPRRVYGHAPHAKFIYIMRDPVDRLFSAYWHTVRAGEESRELREAVRLNPGYAAPSCYVAQIQAYLNYFDITSFLFIDFRVLVRWPDEIVTACLDFIGVDPAPGEISHEQPKNQSFQYRGLGLAFRQLVGGEKGMKVLSRCVKGVTPEFMHARLKKIIQKDIPDLTPEDRIWIARHLGEANKDLKELTGVDFTV